MKYIISSTGNKIEFNLSGTRKLVLDTKIPTQVEDHEYLILESRLGSQIQSVNMNDSTEETEEVAPEVETTPEVETPSEETEEVA